MLQSFGQSSSVLRSSTKASSSSSPCKLQSLYSPFHSKLSFRFNFSNTSHFTNISHAHEWNLSKDRILLGFRPKFRCKCVSSPEKKSSEGNYGKYRGELRSVLLSLESEGGDVEKALGLYYGNLSPRSQTVVLIEQRKWSKVLRVFEWFKSQEDYIPNVVHYNVVLRALGRAQKWDELRLCWIDMAKNSVVPTNNTYSMLVDVYGKAGLAREGLLWIKHMKSRGMFPDEVTMSTVIKVLKDAGEYDRADKFYKDWRVGRIELDDLDLGDSGDMEPISLKQFLSTELFRTGGRMHSSTDSNMSNAESSVNELRLTSTYNTLIDLYGKAGRLKDAADVFSDMLNSGVALDAFTFNTMIHICGTRGSLSEAEALLEKMDEKGVSPDAKTYNIFISLYANVGNVDTILGCYWKIREVGLFPDEVTYRAVLRILCERNMVQEVEVVLKEMEKLEKHVDGSTLPVLVKMFVNEGLTERAKFLVESSQSYHDLSSRNRAAIIDVYAEKGLWAEAESVFYSKRDGHGQNDVLEYNVMIKAYGKAQLYGKAVSLFRGMRNQGTWPDRCTYNSLIQMLTRGDSVDEAREIMAEMQVSKYKPSCTTFAALIAALAKNARLSDAVQVFEEMSRSDVKPNEVVFGLLIDAFAKAGNFEDAIHYFHTMEDYGISANQVILTSMIKAYRVVGSVEGANKLYEKIKKLDGGPDIVASNTMLSLYADLGMVSGAKGIYDDLRVQKCADVVTFTTMMQVYRKTGRFDEAIEVAEEMKTSVISRDCFAFNEVMACYAANGQLRECGELLYEMLAEQKLSPDDETLRILFTILKKAGYPPPTVRNLVTSYMGGKMFSVQPVITAVFSILGLHKYALQSCGIKKEDLRFNSVAYNALIHAYTDHGKTVEALDMYKKMQDAGFEPDIVTYVNVVRCYGKAWMVEGVKRIHGMLTSGEIEPDKVLYKAVIDAYKNVNRHDLADMATQQMKYAFEEKENETENETTDEYGPDETEDEYDPDETEDESS